MTAEEPDQDTAVISAEITDVERCLGEARRLYNRDPDHCQRQIDGFTVRLRRLHERLVALGEEQRAR